MSLSPTGYSASCFNSRVVIFLSLVCLLQYCDKLARMFRRHFFYAKAMNLLYERIRTRLRGCGLPCQVPGYLPNSSCLRTVPPPNRERPLVLVGVWARASRLEPHAIRNNRPGIAFCKSSRRILSPSTLDSRHRRRVLWSHAHQRQDHLPIWFRLDRLCGGSCSHAAVTSERWGLVAD